jgi:hypothetical protein
MSIWAISTNDIWFGIGNMIHWNGANFVPVELPANAWGPYRINKIWGYGRELFIVGDQGHIAHFDGSSWQQISNSAGVTLDDVWGSIDSASGQRRVLAVGTRHTTGLELSLVEINGANAKSQETSGMLPGETSTWFSPCSPYYVVGNRIYMKSALSDTGWKESNYFISSFAEKVRGNGPNDVFVVGDFGMVVHYNGASWRNYQTDGSLPYVPDGIWVSIAVNKNLAVAVGLIGNKAAMLVGRRH